MSNMIIIVTLGCYKRGNYCEALILVPCGSEVCFIADCLPNIQTSGSETIRFFSCGEQTTGIQSAPQMTHVVRKVDGAVLQQTTRGQSAGSDPFCFLFVPWSSPLEKSVSATNLWLCTWQRFQQRNTCVSGRSNLQWWVLENPDEDTYFNETIPMDWDSCWNLRSLHLDSL